MTQHIFQPGKSDLTYLAPSHELELNKVIDDFPQLFTDRLGKTNILEHEIVLSDSVPVKIATL